MVTANPRHFPWTVRYAKARVDFGQPVPSWLRLAVAMAYEAGGCPSHGGQ